VSQRGTDLLELERTNATFGGYTRIKLNDEPRVWVDRGFNNDSRGFAPLRRIRKRADHESHCSNQVIRRVHTSEIILMRDPTGNRSAAAMARTGTLASLFVVRRRCRDLSTTSYQPPATSYRQQAYSSPRCERATESENGTGIRPAALFFYWSKETGQTGKKIKLA
jgi:hypothetical protein